MFRLEPSPTPQPGLCFEDFLSLQDRNKCEFFAGSAALSEVCDLRVLLFDVVDY